MARGVGLVAAGGVGVALGAAIGMVAALRRDRPMHAVGRTHHAVVHRTADAESSGVAWLDRPGERTGLVRFSRGAGLPPWAPDVQGLALRLAEPDGGHTDVLLSSTGLTGLARYTLLPRRSPLGGPASTLMPFRGPHGPVVLAARPLAPDDTSRAARRTARRAIRRSVRRDAAPALAGTRWTLLWSGASGPWRPFAVLTVGADAGPGADHRTRFDPIGATPPGLPPYRWAAALRDPAYRAARHLGRPGRSRGRPGESRTGLG
ncbi:hypothetical protein [Cellulomonas sp. ATA003]|uniref:hypothetical protein n=1 Tax=Cellulomonas sp. ATA003 TaxID=3073064 RepID=UPI0028735965|nr:hypothetical protein [Cellulomonas sp. ATA003]WNB84374.1 hypothetical protein REH70_10850 [Cellulomonas sp. ATA003]